MKLPKSLEAKFNKWKIKLGIKGDFQAGDMVKASKIKPKKALGKKKGS